MYSVMLSRTILSSLDRFFENDLAQFMTYVLTDRGSPFLSSSWVMSSFVERLRYTLELVKQVRLKEEV